MKITKILSTVAAAAVVTSALAVSASAMLVPQASTNNYVCAEGNANYCIVPFSSGAGDAPASTLAQDYGFALDDIGGMRVVVQVPEKDSFGTDGNRLWWDGSIGGGIVTSLHSDVDLSTYNWPSQGMFWGVNDEELGFNTINAAEAFAFEKIGDYTYELVAPFNFDEAVNSIEGELVQYRVFIQFWDNGMADYEIIECALLDDAGNDLVTLDGQGYPIGGTPAAGGDTGSDTVVDTDAPVAGGDKTSPDTGVEGVAAVAGLAVVAAGAVVLSKKRK